METNKLDAEIISILTQDELIVGTPESHLYKVYLKLKSVTKIAEIEGRIRSIVTSSGNQRVICSVETKIGTQKVL